MQHTSQNADNEAQGPIIGLLGHTGNSNLGDEAITEAVIQNLKARIPGVRFRLFTINPNDGERRHGYPAFPLRPSGKATISSMLFRSWQPVDKDAKSPRAGLTPLHERDGWSYTEVEWRPPWKERLKSFIKLVLKGPSIWRNEHRFSRTNRELLSDMDLLIVTGSNQFLDNYGGPWAFPYTLYRWSRLAAKTQTPFAYASLGAGPIYSGLSMNIICRAIHASKYVSVRDTPSKWLLEQGGCESNIKVMPDLAFSLTNQPDNAARQANWQHPVVGINPMPVYASDYWYVADNVLYMNYVNALADFALTLKQDGHPFFFFATQPKDENVMVDIFIRMQAQSDDEIDTEALVKKSSRVSELVDIVHSADVIIATRFHGTVLGLFANKPVIGTCYYRKSGDLLEEFGLHDHVHQLETLTAAQLRTSFDSISANHATLIERIGRTKAQYQKKLDTQYEELIALM